MDAEHEVRQTENTIVKIRGKIKSNVQKIDFDIVVNMHVLVFLIHAVVSAYLARPVLITMALDSSPFLALVLSFLFAKTLYHKFGAQKEIILPLFRSIELKIKSIQRPIITKEIEERVAMGFTIFMVTCICVRVAYELPAERFWPMKVWFTIFWINEDLQFFLALGCRSITDVGKKRTIAKVLCVSLSIMSTQGCYLLVMAFLSFKWTIPCLALTFITSFRFWVFCLIPYLIGGP